VSGSTIAAVSTIAGVGSRGRGLVSTQLMILGFVVPTTEVSTKLPVGEDVVAWATGVVGTDTPERCAELWAGAGVGIMPKKRTITAARYSNAANAEFARANGWVAQVRRLTQQNHDWFLITDAYSLIGTAEYEAAAQLLSRTAQGASYRRQIDLVAFATTIWSRALIKTGRVKEGLSRLDEAMLPVIDGDASPRARSMMYCAAIATCHEVREFAERASGRSHWARGPTLLRTEGRILRQLPDLPVSPDAPLRFMARSGERGCGGVRRPEWRLRPAGGRPCLLSAR
jgi:hypothetical protein